MLLSQIFVASVCLSLLTIDGFKTWESYKERVRENTILSGNLARSVAQNAEDTIKQADTVLVGLVERIERDGTSRAALERLQKVLVLHVGELPKLHGLFVYDATGRWLTTNRNMVLNANNSDREYFIYHKTHPDRHVYISKPVHSRSTGEWIIPLSRRINRADGSFAGVVLATVHMKYFRNFYDTFNIGRDGTIALVHMKGAILVQRPFQDERIGFDLKNTPLFQEHVANSPTGTYRADSTYFDRNERIVSYHRVEGHPLLAVATLSEDEVFRPWWMDAAKHFAITLILTIVLGFMGYRLMRQIGQRLDAEGQLRDAQNTLESLNQELEQMAWLDGLTGLANRRRFDVDLNEEFHRAMRREEPLALILIDIDHFKQYNDSYGHIEGDKCLQKIGRVLKSCMKREGDLSVRYGGEELAVLLPNTDEEGAMVVAERLISAIRQMNIRHKDSPTGLVTVSCGVHALIPFRGRNIPADLLQAADTALYAAKAAGRDQIVCASKLKGTE
ncbi:MAG: GGDEF domain-containing protein [Oxalobacter sp.]|nr:MAG: GGDEF domain-containing protein [Oxalobacter sp.]